jgi:hypothetical protein
MPVYGRRKYSERTELLLYALVTVLALAVLAWHRYYYAW